MGRFHTFGEGVLRWSADTAEDPAMVAFQHAQAVGLMAEGNRWVHFDRVPVGKTVRLLATVIALRGPVLAEDASRGIVPSMPWLGETVELGHGTLFACDAFDGARTGVGVVPEQAVAVGDWLDRGRLYRTHNHIVRLGYVEDRRWHFRTLRQRDPLAA
ncbi:hypothetical protein [Glycomyces arizonensis]|uniref:hypothetical protein n=1 Tax=Glycomyces arizonensis TaxID=256035 RepID=UPI00040F577F|nr:hypothetical protein [Glycomyces arizonensis]